MNEVNIKPISVNECYKGRRYRTPKYDKYERDLRFILPKIVMPEPPYKIHFVFGLSSLASDGDNCVKNTQDVISKHYGFNDKLIKRWVIEVEKTKKGQEFFKFNLESLR